MFQDEIEKDLLEAAEEVENKYQEFFREKMKEWGIKSPKELSYEDSKKFFSEIEKEWNSEKNESVEDEGLNEGVNDVYADIYNNMINPTINKVGDILTFPWEGVDTSFEVKLIVEPTKFGDESKYYLKALNGPIKGSDIVLNQSFIQENVKKEDEISEDEKNLLEELTQNGNEEDEFDYTDEDVDLDKLLKLKESVDIDVTEVDNDKLEKVLKMFMDKKAEDSVDYELASSGDKLLLKVYNNKFASDAKKILK